MKAHKSDLQENDQIFILGNNVTMIDYGYGTLLVVENNILDIAVLKVDDVWNLIINVSE